MVEKTELANVNKAVKLAKDVPIKKKRGRKPKIKTPEEIEREKNKPKQRRGRKPKSQMIVKKDISEYINKTDEEETIILNLKIDPNSSNPTELDNHYDNNQLDNQLDNHYDNNQLNNQLNNQYSNTEIRLNENLLNNTNLCGYDNNDNFSSYPSNILKEGISKSSNNNNNYNNNYCRKSVCNSLETFIENKDWIKKTNVNCWWCCHKFENTPIGLPTKYKDEKFLVSGCFCSFECASSYNFYENNATQDVWECYSLINLLSQKIGYKNIVKLAPHKISLKMFGGNLEIDEFRNFTNHNKIVNVLDYPMIACNQQLEEINYNVNNNMNNFIPIDENRLKKIEQKIKLSRNKPLSNKKNTLEHTMNIKISNL